MLVYEKDNKLNIKFDSQNGGEELDNPDFSIYKDNENKVTISANGNTGDVGGGLTEEQIRNLNILAKAIASGGIGYIDYGNTLIEGEESHGQILTVTPATVIFSTDMEHLSLKATLGNQTSIAEINSKDLIEEGTTLRYVFEDFTHYLSLVYDSSTNSNKLYWTKKIGGGVPVGTKHVKIEGPVTVSYIDSRIIDRHDDGETK